MSHLTLIVILFLAGAPIAAAADDKQTTVSIQTAQNRYSRSVVSFHELRQSRLIRQSWDTSCGAAALSTLLTYHAGMPVSEYAVAASILRTSDPKRVRQRGGFSLLDLKRFVEAVGLTGEGFGSMKVKDLDANGEPAILPIRSRNLDHFVVFRGRVGDRILLGDPAFGNITMTLSEFDAAWRGGIAFYVRKPGQASQKRQFGINERDLAVADVAQVTRMLREARPVPAMRQLPLVARVKTK